MNYRVRRASPQQPANAQAATEPPPDVGSGVVDQRPDRADFIEGPGAAGAGEGHQLLDRPQRAARRRWAAAAAAIEPQRALLEDRPQVGLVEPGRQLLTDIPVVRAGPRLDLAHRAALAGEGDQRARL